MGVGGEDSQEVYRERGEGRAYRKRKRDKTIETEGNGKREEVGQNSSPTGFRL